MNGWTRRCLQNARELARTPNQGPFDRWSVSPRVNPARSDGPDLPAPYAA